MLDDTLQPYRRVIPRDLFNESKLLKCMGRVVLLHHEGIDKGLLVIQHKNPNRGFDIVQDTSSGILYVRNLTVHLNDGRRIMMGTLYNSKDEYPLEYNVMDEEYGSVLKEDGSFSDEFKTLIGL